MESKDYQTFTTFDNESEKEELVGQPLQIHSNPNTPVAATTPNICTPITPNTPSTPSTPASVSDETDRSQFSLSIDSGIESPQGFMMPGTHIQNLMNGRNQIRPNKQKCSPTTKAADHTNKEKLRRERIKDSCDQLRVLLPYIRGRKTDMASVLEMCVEYLRIVNAVMPQTLQEQIVDILSKESPPAFPSKGKENKSVLSHPCPKEELTIASAGSLQQGYIAGKTPEFTLTSTENLSSCDVHNNNYNEDKSAKRLRLQENNGLGVHAQDGNSGTGSHFEDRIDLTSNAGSCHGDVTPTYSFHGNQVGNIHLEDQNFGRLYSEGYSTAQQIFNNYTSNKNLQLEPEYLRPTYLDSYHFYPGMVNNGVPQARLYTTTTDYVNPNAVLQTLPYSSMIVKPVVGSGKGDNFSPVNSVDQTKDDKSPRTP